MLRRALLSLALLVALLTTTVAPAVAEEAGPFCRLYYSHSGWLYHYYRWGEGMSGFPGSADYVNAYTAAANAWTSTPTPIYLRYSSTGKMQAHTKWAYNNWWYGWMDSDPGCVAPGTLQGSRVWVNRWTKNMEGWSWQRLQEIAGHEMGHGLGMSEILDPRLTIMAPSPDVGVYMPQAPEIELLNQIYWR